MDKNKKQYYKSKLLEEKEKLKSIINKMDNKEELGSMEDYYSELSIRDNHPADLGTEVYMMELDKGLKNRIIDTIAEVDDSLEKIKNKTFGLCNICNNQIGEERLSIIPYVKLCINCAENENIRGNNEELKLSGANLVESYNRSKKDILFDDEDSYQAVARFNEIKKDPSFSTGDNQGIFDEEEGLVEEVENISEEDYKNSLE